LTGLILILFLFATWCIGIVIDTSIAMAETGVRGVGVDLMPVFWIAIVGTVVAAVIRGRKTVLVPILFLTSAIILSWYFLIVFAFDFSAMMIFAIIVISALALWRGSKDEEMSYYLGAIAILTAILLIAQFISTGGGMIPIEIESNGEPPSLIPGDPGGFIESTLGGFGTFLLIVLVGGILAFLTVQRVVPLLRSSSKDDEEELEDQLSSTVDKAVTELKEGKDVHSTILRCYQRMCLILEEMGAKNFEFMTPREFEIQAKRTLDVPTSKITEIREVFELAQYSNYKLGEKERKKAVMALKELRKELE